jgi:hypothetical protein
MEPELDSESEKMEPETDSESESESHVGMVQLHFGVEGDSEGPFSLSRVRILYVKGFRV